MSRARAGLAGRSAADADQLARFGYIDRRDQSKLRSADRQAPLPADPKDDPACVGCALAGEHHAPQKACALGKAGRAEALMINPSLTRDERETIVFAHDTLGEVSVHTSQRSVISALRAKVATGAAVREVETKTYGSTEWADFRFDAGEASWAGFIKRGTGYPVEPDDRMESLSPAPDLGTRWPASERETVVTSDDGSDIVTIDSWQPSVVRQLRRKAKESGRLVEVPQTVGDPQHGTFQIHAGAVSWRGLVKRRGNSTGVGRSGSKTLSPASFLDRTRPSRGAA